MNALGVLITVAHVPQRIDVHRHNNKLRVLKQSIGAVGLQDVHRCYCKRMAAATAAVAARVAVALVVAVAIPVSGKCIYQV